MRLEDIIAGLREERIKTDRHVFYWDDVWDERPNVEVRHKQNTAMKNKKWILAAIVAAVVVLGALAVHYLPVMWSVVGGVALLVGAAVGWGLCRWWR